MAFLNSCNFIGHLGHNPKSAVTKNGTQVANFSIASTKKYNGNEKTEWIDITAFGKLAEIATQYLTKGSQVYVGGELSTDKFTNREGQEVKKTYIVARDIQMIGGKAKPAETPAEEDEYDSESIPF